MIDGIDPISTVIYDMHDSPHAFLHYNVSVIYSFNSKVEGVDFPPQLHMCVKITGEIYSREDLLLSLSVTLFKVLKATNYCI